MGKVADVLQNGIDQGLHTGAQIYVSLKGRSQIDFAIGESRSGVPMSTHSIIQWYSSGKPLTAIAIAQLLDQNKLELSDPISRYIPAFSGDGRDAITIQHLLTHTAGIRPADKLPADLDWPIALERIAGTNLEKDWPAGEKAGYSSMAGWFLLGEAIQNIVDRPFDEFMRREVLEPLGMHDTWLRLPFEKFRNYGDQIAPMFQLKDGTRELAELQDSFGMAICRPGSSARGPVRELGLFYEMLLNRGNVQGRRFLESPTVDYFTTPRRTGIFDQTFLSRLDWGLGFLLNSHPHDPEKSPYGYGRSASPQTFGHSGVQSSCAFADPKHQLVVAWVCNCMPGERAHQARQRAINNAVYEELGLTS
ncbi:MAG: serine hydrolase domain-containing protein [Verrucomicrobiota bacterium]